MSVDTLHRACAGFALSAALVACALDSDDLGLDADSTGEINPAEDDLGLWTGISAPPYNVGALSPTRQVLELDPQAGGDITLVASLRWRDHAAGAIDPQVSFGLISDSGEQTLLQVFESDGRIRARADLEMTDVLEVGAWYRVVLTIADAPGRPMQVRIFDAAGVEAWRSCGDAARCPATNISADDLESLRLSVTVDDVRVGEGHIDLSNISLKHNP